MQSWITTIRDVLCLRDHGYKPEVIPSRDRWNPIAALVLRDVVLPASVEPPIIDIRVPVPNLYGFVDLAVRFAIFEGYIIERETRKRVPFCRLLSEEDISRHRDYYVDLREQRAWPMQPCYICVTPPVELQSVENDFDMLSFVKALTVFLMAPTESVRRELRVREKEWRSNPNAWLLARIGHLHEGLGEKKTAVSIYREATRRFPGQVEFAQLLARVEADDEGVRVR